jgi:hypothetical protein
MVRLLVTPWTVMTTPLKIMFGAFLLAALAGCDSNVVPLEEPPFAACDVFDQRCLHCEVIGEGEACEVEGAPGICTMMRPIQGPQVLVEGLRCRPK